MRLNLLFAMPPLLAQALDNTVASASFQTRTHNVNLIKMKKVIGILGVAVIAATMFFSANTMSGSTTDANLASLIAMNVANAETSTGSKCYWTLVIGNELTINRCGVSCSAVLCKNALDSGVCP